MPKQGDYQLSYPNLLHAENNIELLEPFKGAKAHHLMKCLSCNHEWSATPISKRQTYKRHGVSGCPACKTARENQKNQQIRDQRLEELKQRGIEIITEGYDGRRHTIDHNTYTKILVRNTNCGHEFYCSPSNLMTQDVDCAVCGPQKRVEPLTRWSKENSRKWRETATEWQKYKAEVSSLTRKNYTKYKSVINPKNLPRGKAGQQDAYHLDHRVPIRFCFENDIPAEICAHQSNLQMLHWNDNVGSRNNLKGTPPPIFLQYLNCGTRIQHYAQLIQQHAFPKAQMFVQLGDVTVTLFDKSNNHAVIVIPLDQTYADMKIANSAVKQLMQLNLNYSVIFEDELLQNEALVLNKLAHYSQQNQAQKIYARQCTIQQVDKKAKGQFLKQFHIQGNDTGQINLGAFYDQQLVAVMTFCKPRVALGYKEQDRSKYKGIWELSRFTTNTDFRIPGVASKLLKHFERTNQWNKIFSYADRRWSIGNLYDQLGFQLERTNPPDYFYVINNQRKHRWNYRKDKLRDTLLEYDSSLTEYQNMTNAGYWRVWDCGTLCYTKNNNLP